MSRILKFATFVAIHLVIAVIGTAILDTSLRRRLAAPLYSFSGIIWTESLLSIVFAMALGFGVWRVWHNSAGKYTWVPAVAWLVIGFLSTLGRSDIWGRFFSFGSGGGIRPAEMRTFFAFTVPLIRAACYSLGTYIPSLFRAAPVPSRS